MALIIFIGDLVCGKPEGKGKLVDRDKNEYEGNWKNGQILIG